MQVYKPIENRFYYQDKYYGRSLSTAPQLRDSLSAFLDDGSGVRYQLIPALLNDLRRLRAEISRLSGFRFFASSLLLIYDGLQESKSFLQPTTTLSSSTSSPVVNPAAAGLVNLVETQTTPVSVAASQTESVTSQPVFRQSDSIRLCMVDFAHCLTKRRSDDIRRRAEERSVQMAIQGGADALLMREEQGTLQGPDGGYLTGLDTLIELFQAIFNHCNSLHGSPNMVNCRQQSVADEINLARSLARTVSLSSVPEEDSPHPKSSRIRQTALQQPKPRAISISTGFAVPSQPSLATSPVTVMHSSSSDPFSTAGDHDADGKDLEAVGERRKRSTIAVLNKFVEARERFEGGRS